MVNRREEGNEILHIEFEEIIKDSPPDAGRVSRIIDEKMAAGTKSA